LGLAGAPLFLQRSEGFWLLFLLFLLSSPQGICFTRTGTNAIKGRRKRKTKNHADTLAIKYPAHHD
jgi:hypothetical protein